MTTYFVDYIGGNDSFAGTTFGTRRKTLPPSLSPNDFVKVMMSKAPSNTGKTGAFVNKGRIVQLNGVVASVINYCDGGASGGAFVSGGGSFIVTFPTFPSQRAGNAALQIQNTAGGGGSGKAAYATFLEANSPFAAEVRDYSGYQQLCFWIRSSAAITANSIRIDLCSDTAGDVPVNSFTLNFDIPNVGTWIPIVLDNGSPLGSSLRSIAIVALNTLSSGVTWFFDQFTACKAPSAVDSLTFRSLVGKNTAGEGWYAVKQFLTNQYFSNGNLDVVGIELDVDTNHPTNVFTLVSSTSRGYSGTTETVALWKREPIFMPLLTTTSSIQQTLTNSGTAGNRIQISGGWDETDMSTQPGYTFLSGGGYGTGIAWSNADYTLFEKFGIYRYGTGMTNSTSAVAEIELKDCYWGNCITAALSSTMKNLFISGTHIAVCNGSNGFTLNGGSTFDDKGTKIENVTVLSTQTSSGILCQGSIGTFQGIGTIKCNNNGGEGLALQGNGARLNVVQCADNGTHGVSITSLGRSTVIKTLTVTNNSSFGVRFDHSNTVKIGTWTSSGNLSGAFAHSSSYGSITKLGNVNISESTTTLFNTVLTSYDQEKKLFLHKYLSGGGLGASDHRTYGAGYKIESAVSPDAITGLGWKITPVNSFRDALNPVVFGEDGEFIRAVASGNLVTIKVNARRSSSNVAGQIRVAGGKIAGIPNDVVSAINGAAGSFIEYTLTCTPTEAGAIEVYVDVWTTASGSSLTDYIAIDNITISQA